MQSMVSSHVLMYRHEYFTVIENGDVANAKMLQNVKPTNVKLVPLSKI